MATPIQKIGAKMLLDAVEAMIAERPVERDTGQNYRRSIRFFGTHLGRPATADDLKEQLVNDWLATVAKARSPATVRGHKASITSVWNWLAEQRLVEPYHPRRLRRIRVTTPAPMPWSMDQVRSLLKGADALKGRLLSGLAASDLMRAWVIVGYESALRPSDMRRLSPRSILGSRIVVVQHKTGQPHSCTLSPTALESLQPLIAIGGETLFPSSKDTIRRWELLLFESAKEYGFTRQRRQGIGTLRKTNATEVCRRDGIDAAAKSLGHISGTMIARRHYVAPDAIAETPSPPALIHALAKPKRNHRKGDRDHSRRTG